MTDLFSTIPLDVVSGIIGAIAGLVVAFLLACAAVLLVSIRRRLNLYNAAWRYTPKKHYPMATKR